MRHQETLKPPNIIYFWMSIILKTHDFFKALKKMTEIIKLPAVLNGREP